MRILIAALFVAFMGGDALSQTCGQLRAQLASLQSGTPNTALLSRLQNRYRAYGCTASGSFGRNRMCGQIEAQMAQARRGGGDARQIRRLRQRMARACGTETRSARGRSAPQRQQTTRTIGDRIVTVNASPQRSVFSIFQGAEESHSPNRYDGRVERLDLDEHKPKRSTGSGGSGSSGGPLRIGSARTMCVRLCDGFYFPINRNSHHRNFYDELAMCVGRCPGADVSLYAHKSDAPVESMRSALTGERYVNLPTAFLYRRERVDDCTCQPQTIAATGSAGEALGYVGMSASGDDETPESASEAATAAAGGSGWERLRAVYDETGKPLEETLRKLRQRTETARSGRRSDEDTEAADPVIASDAADGGAAEDGDMVTVASSSLRLREVGPQFFSPDGEQESRTRRFIRPSLSSTAVSVMPVRSSIVISGEGDAEAANEAEAIIVPEEEGTPAQTSRLSEDITGG